MRNLDLFSSIFQFNVSPKQAAKKTTFGALLGICIFGISFTYLGYLASIYFQNQYLPKINSTDAIPPTTQFTTSPQQFIFTMMIYNMPHRAYAKSIGANIISYKVQYNVAQPNSASPKMTTVNVVQCTDKVYTDYDCLDLNSSNDLIVQQPYGQNTLNNNFVIWVYPCQAGNNCAAAGAITAALAYPGNHFILLSAVDQYDVSNKSFNSLYFNFSYQISQSLTIFTIIQAVTNIYKITDGPFVQTTNSYQKIKSYKRVDSYFTATDTIGNSGAVVAVVIGVDQSQATTEIQFPQITEIIAQFTSILNVLLVFGYFGKKASQSQLYKDIKNVIIKSTFQNKYRTNNNREPKDVINMMRIHPATNNPSNSPDQEIVNNLINFQKQEDAEEIITKQHSKKEKSQLIEYFDKKTEKVMNIENMLSDFMFMQRAIKMMLTKEQYVALQFCGQDIDLSADADSQKTGGIKAEPEDEVINLDAKTPETENHKENENKGTPLLQVKKQGILGEKQIELSNSHLIADPQSAKLHTQNKKIFNNNYLSELDELDSNDGEKERLLRDYLKIIQNKDQSQLSQIDAKIHSCLFSS